MTPIKKKVNDIKPKFIFGFVFYNMITRNANEMLFDGFCVSDNFIMSRR